jgi:hypothetical protein
MNQMISRHLPFSASRNLVRASKSHLLHAGSTTFAGGFPAESSLRAKPVSKRNAQAMSPHFHNPQAGTMARVGDIPLRKPGNAVSAPR